MQSLAAQLSRLVLTQCMISRIFPDDHTSSTAFADAKLSSDGSFLEVATDGEELFYMQCTTR